MANARNAKSAREKAAQMRAEAERVAARKRAIVAGLAVVVVILLAVGLTVLFRSLQAQQKAREAAAVAPPANVHNGVSTVGGGLLVGTPDAKVTVDIYEDFICPICKEFEEADGPILKKYADAGQIKIVYHPVAILDRASVGTRYSTRAANAVAAVLNSSPSAAITFHSLLFENQPPENGPGLPDDTLLALAEKAGANRAAIQDDIAKLRYEGWITSTTEKFTKDFPPGGTPTIAIDGKPHKDLAPDKLTAAIEAAIKK
jgi:protein-disulfide isomerase